MKKTIWGENEKRQPSNENESHAQKYDAHLWNGGSFVEHETTS